IEIVQAPYTPGPGGEGDAIIKVNIPAIGVNNLQVIFNNTDGAEINPGAHFSSARSLIIGGTNLDYTLAGAWLDVFPTNNSLRTMGVFFTGFQTPVASIP